MADWPMPYTHSGRVYNGLQNGFEGAGGPSIIAQLNGGTGESLFLPRMDDARARAYAWNKVCLNDVWAEDADPDLLRGLVLLEAEGRIVAVRTGKRTLYSKPESYYGSVPVPARRQGDVRGPLEFELYGGTEEEWSNQGEGA